MYAIQNYDFCREYGLDCVDETNFKEEEADKIEEEILTKEEMEKWRKDWAKANNEAVPYRKIY